MCLLLRCGGLWEGGQDKLQLTVSLSQHNWDNPMRGYQAALMLENDWRGVILFGNNVASYKFALICALYNLHT